jgi:hypothetical protein
MTLFTVTVRRIDNLKYDASIPIEKGTLDLSLFSLIWKVKLEIMPAQDDAGVGRRQYLGQSGPA